MEPSETVMNVPCDLVPRVREMIARGHSRTGAAMSPGVLTSAPYAWRASCAAAIVRAMSPAVCAAETKAASNCEGAR